MDWLTDNKLPIGKWAKALFDWLTDNAAWVFDGISIFLETLIDGILWLLQTPHPLVIVAIAAGIGYAVHRTIAFAAFVAVLALLLIINQGYWEETTETLALVIWPPPSSAWPCRCADRRFGARTIRAFMPRSGPVLDLMQTIPTFVYLIPALILFGLGMVPGLIATVIFAIPAPIRLTQLGVSSTPKALLEAGRHSGRPSPSCSGRSNCPMRCRRSWPV